MDVLDTFVGCPLFATAGLHAIPVQHKCQKQCCALPPSLQGRTLTTAWVGDSRMVLGRQKKKGWRSAWEAIDLSIDHKPTIPEERQRILDTHGRVERCVKWHTYSVQG